MKKITSSTLTQKKKQNLVARSYSPQYRLVYEFCKKTFTSSTAHPQAVRELCALMGRSSISHLPLIPLSFLIVTCVVVSLSLIMGFVGFEGI